MPVVRPLGLTGMATDYASVAGLPPPPYTMAWLAWYYRLLTARIAECPIERTTRYYIKYDAAGSGVGGGGAGTSVDPWKCATPAHINTLIAANDGSGDVRFSLRRGDTFYDDGTGAGGITLSQPNLTLDDYADGTSNHKTDSPPPNISGFRAPYTSAGWTNHGVQTNLWYRDVSSDGEPFWYREDDNPENAYARRTKATALATLNGLTATGAWVYDDDDTLGLGATTLIVCKRTGAPAGAPTGQICISSAGAGVSIAATSNGCRVHNIRADGWGMYNVDSQVTPFLSSLTGTNAGVFSNCTGYYSCKHTVHHYVGASSGGIATFLNCTAGLAMNDATPFNTPFNAYASSGGFEAVFHSCNCTHGGLLDETNTTGYKGGALYAHTSGGANKIGLLVSFGMKGPKATSPLGVKAWTGASDAPAMANRNDIAAIRVFFVRDEFDDINADGNILWFRNSARINSRVRIRPQGAMANGGLDTNGSAADSFHGFSANNTFDADLTSSSGTQIGFWNYTGLQSGIHSMHDLWTWKNKAGQYAYMDYDNVGAANVPTRESVAVNSIFGCYGPDKNIIAATARSYFNWTRDQAPTTSQGGASGCGFAGIFNTADGASMTNYGSTQNPVYFGSPAEAINGPGMHWPANALSAVGIHPSGWRLEYDADWRERTSTNNPIGPRIIDKKVATFYEPFRTNRVSR